MIERNSIGLKIEKTERHSFFSDMLLLRRRKIEWMTKFDDLLKSKNKIVAELTSGDGKKESTAMFSRGYENYR